jgi:hypothetical protein
MVTGVVMYEITAGKKSVTLTEEFGRPHRMVMMNGAQWSSVPVDDEVLSMIAKIIDEYFTNKRKGQEVGTSDELQIMDRKCREAFESSFTDKSKISRYGAEHNFNYVDVNVHFQWLTHRAAWNAALAAALDVVTCDEEKTLRGISELRAKTDG